MVLQAFLVSEVLKAKKVQVKMVQLVLLDQLEQVDLGVFLD